MLLPGVSAVAASGIADRIERSIAEPLCIENGPSSITATVGVSASSGGATIRDLVISADMAMLSGKRDRAAAERVPASI